MITDEAAARLAEAASAGLAQMANDLAEANRLLALLLSEESEYPIETGGNDFLDRLEAELEHIKTLSAEAKSEVNRLSHEPDVLRSLPAVCQDGREDGMLDTLYLLSSALAEAQILLQRGGVKVRVRRNRLHQETFRLRQEMVRLRQEMVAASHREPPGEGEPPKPTKEDSDVLKLVLDFIRTPENRKKSFIHNKTFYGEKSSLCHHVATNLQGGVLLSEGGVYSRIERIFEHRGIKPLNGSFTVAALLHVAEEIERAVF